MILPPRTEWIIATVLAMALITVATAPTRAADDAPEAAPPAAGNEAAATQDPMAAELDKRVEQLTEKMQRAKSQLAERNTGEETQTLQKQILAELDELLKSPPQPPKSNSSAGNSGGASGTGSTNQQQSSSSSQQQDSSETAQQAQDPSQGKPQGAPQEREQAEDSEERIGQAKTRTVPPLQRQRLEVDVWGHLPDKVREKLLSAYGERMVPQYEDLVQRFYQSLAETATARE